MTWRRFQKWLHGSRRKNATAAKWAGYGVCLMLAVATGNWSQDTDRMRRNFKRHAARWTKMRGNKFLSGVRP